VTEAVAGALVGGLIAIAGSFTAQLLEHRRQNVDRRITFLRDNKAELERLYDGISENLNEGMNSGIFNVSNSMDAIYRCPTHVRDAYLKATAAKSVDEKKECFQDVIAEMKKSIVQIDNQIFQELGGK